MSDNPLPITKEPADILHKKMKKVLDINNKIMDLVTQMRESMVAANGIGIAANQVGKDIQVFLIDEKLATEHDVSQVYINPELSDFSDELESLQEGCLSVPDYWVDISRSKKVKIKALDQDGKKIRFRAKGMLARVLQHEFDHLQGKLITDRAAEQS